MVKGALRVSNKRLDIVKDSRYFGMQRRKENTSIPNARQWLVNRMQPLWHDLTPLNTLRIVTRFWTGYFLMDKKMGDGAVRGDCDFNRLEENILRWEAKD